MILALAACSNEADDPLGPDPTVPTMSFEEAMALVRQERFTEAEAALRPFVSVPEPETPALMLYARALMGDKRNSLAVWFLQRAVERPDAPPLAPQLYLQALLAGGDEFTAIDFATEQLEKDPDNLRFRDIRSQAYEVALDLERAVEDLEIVADENPDQARIVERLLNLLIQIEDWDSARERIDELRVLLQREGVKQEIRTTFCAQAARFERERGAAEDAERDLRACLETYPADANLVFALEELLDRTDRVDEATALLAELAAAYPKRQLLRQGYAARLARLGRIDEADAVLLETAQADDHPNSWISLANLRMNFGDLDGTVEALDAAITAAMDKPVDDPDLDWGSMLADSRFGIGDVYVRAGHYERAERIIVSLEEEEPAMALLLAARIKLEQGDPAAALEDYREAFRTYPSNPAARYLAGRAAVEVGEFDQARDLYQDALRADPNATDAGMVLAQMLIGEGRVNWALDALAFQLARGGRQPHETRLMAKAAAAASFHDFAEGLRADLAKDIDWAGIALADQARDLAALSGAEAARDYLAQSEMLEAPTHFEAFSTWVRLAIASGEEKAAREREARFHDEHGETMGAWVVRGRLLRQDEMPDDAIAAMQRAIELNPTYATAHAELGEMLIEADRLDEGLASFDRAAELDPLEARYAFAPAKALFEADRKEEAEARLEALLIPHPWHGRAALLLFDLAKERGETESEAAYLWARRAARYHVMSGPRASYELARLDLARGNAEEALVGFERAAIGLHEVANARHGMGQALAKLGRSKEAIEQLEIALGSAELAEPLSATTLIEQLKAGEEAL